MKKQILLIIETSRAHGRGILEGISSYVREKNYWKVYFEDRGVSEKLPRWLHAWKGDGIITRSRTTAIARELKDKGIPLVELLGDGKNFSADVEGNEGLVGGLAADYLWGQGFRNFAFFCPDDTFWAKKRLAAYKNRLVEYGSTCEMFRFPKHEMKDYLLNAIMKRTDDFLEKWLLSLPKPLGVLAAIDLHAMYILEACLNAGIAVPEEVAILGCGNDHLFCSLFSPQLSSIDLNSRRIGYEAARLLDMKMNGQPLPPLPISIPPSRIVVRQSTDIIAIEDVEVRKVLNAIRKRFCEPIGIPQIITEFGLSRRTLERRFQQWFHRSMEEELIRMRLEKAKYLLQETNLPVMLVGPQVGISDPHYFMRFFRREIGITPNQYRRQNQIPHPSEE